MFWERFKLSLRRAVAWWIDAFLAAAVIVVLRWLLHLAGVELNGRSGAIYDIVSFALVFYIYRVGFEATKHTTLGKWSLRLEIIGPHGWRPAAIRNSWVLLTLISVTGIRFVEPVIVAILGMSLLVVGRHPFDMAAGNLVVEKLPPELKEK